MCKLLTSTYKKVPCWCNNTVKNALKLKAACGTAGYEELLRQGLLHPTIKTLPAKLDN